MQTSDLKHLRPASRVVSSLTGASPAEAGSTARHSAESFETELLIVEGKSAADAVDQVRDRQWQGIYALQGKIPNPDKLSPKKLQQHAHLGPLLQLLGADDEIQTAPSAGARQRRDKNLEPGTLSRARLNERQYDAVILLPDPDMDGQHNCNLVIRFFRKYLAHYIEQGRLFVFPTPHSRSPATGEGAGRLISDRALQARKPPGSTAVHLTPLKSLASLSRHELASVLSYPLKTQCRGVSLPGRLSSTC